MDTYGYAVLQAAMSSERADRRNSLSIATDYAKDPDAVLSDIKAQRKVLNP